MRCVCRFKRSTHARRGWTQAWTLRTRARRKCRAQAAKAGGDLQRLLDAGAPGVVDGGSRWDG